MAKKMCKHFKTCSARYSVCPQNEKYKMCQGKNSKCEIITRKPKMVKIKAFVSITDGFPDWISEKPFDTCVIPCSIIIDKKYLKGAK